jgi:mycothiol system anti-sigma-R factor
LSKVTVECRKYQEHITAAIDNALQPDERKMLEAHLAQCPHCRSEFEIEKVMRHFVHSRCKRKQAPAHILHSITERIENDTSVREQGMPFWKRLVSSLYFRPAVAFAVACLAVIVLLNTDHSPNVPRTIEASLLPANDVIKQSLTNYMAVARGDIKPQLVSDKVEHVRQFFAGKTDFPVLFPNIQGCKLIGGVLNDFSGKTLAHVVYAHHGSELVYIYEACWQTVESGEPLQLAQDVQRELTTTGRYVLSQPDGYTIVMWRQDSTLCSAVAKLDKETLLECLNLTP